MGYYLNPVDALELYKGETEKPYFVDKTQMLVIGKIKKIFRILKPDTVFDCL